MVRYNRLGYVALNVTDQQRSHDFHEKQVGLQRGGTTGEIEGAEPARAARDTAAA